MSQPRWRVASASVRGSGHEKSGLPCQDAHHWALAGRDLLVAAVADGAGSALLADRGAALAASTAVELLCSGVHSNRLEVSSPDEEWRRLLAQVLSDTRSRLQAEAAEKGVALNDFATTLILTVAGPDFVAAVQVGDGAVVCAEAGGALTTLTRPAQSEYLNETIFLTSENSLVCVEPVVWRRSLTHLALLSDGLQMAALQMPRGEAHPGFFNPLLSFISDPGAAEAKLTEQLQAFLGSPRMRARTDDDVTLLLAALGS